MGRRSGRQKSLRFFPEIVRSVYLTAGIALDGVTTMLLGTNHERRAKMVPLYAARVSDLGPGDFVHVECAACGHDLLIPSSGLLQGLKLPPYKPVLDLERRFRCRECDARGKVVVSIKSGDQA
jgi:hypothetical protein